MSIFSAEYFNNHPLRRIVSGRNAATRQCVCIIRAVCFVDLKQMLHTAQDHKNRINSEYQTHSLRW